MMKVDVEKCIGCAQCVKDCFPQDIKIVEGKAVIKNITCIKCGHCIAICPKAAVSTDAYNMEEVKDFNEKEFLLESDHLLNFIKFRRTVRQFKKIDVEKEKLSKIIEAGRFTQTGSNAQDVSYIVVKEGLDKLKAMAFESLKRTGEAILANITPETRHHGRYAEMWLKMYQDFKDDPVNNDRLFFNAPAVIVVTANSEVNGALASSNMELMTNSMGLGTFFSGFFVMASRESKDIMDFLEIKEGKHVVTCMVIGYPAVKYARTTPRKEADISWK